MGACLTGDVRREHCDYGGSNEILAGRDEIRREIVANLSQFASRFIVIMAGLKKFWRVTTKSGGKSSLPIAICFQVEVPTVRKLTRVSECWQYDVKVKSLYDIAKNEQCSASVSFWRLH